MWETILKKPITIGTTKIGMKPLPEDEEDCCDRAKKEYIKAWEKKKAEFPNLEWEKYPVPINDIGGFKCDDFHVLLFLLSHGGTGTKLSHVMAEDCDRILDEWNKCEGI